MTGRTLTSGSIRVFSRRPILSESSTESNGANEPRGPQDDRREPVWQRPKAAVPVKKEGHRVCAGCPLRIDAVTR